MVHGSVSSRQGATFAPSVREAVADLRAQLEQPDVRVVMVFCSPSYDLATLGPELTRAFPECPVLACTSAGQIGERGFQRGGLTGASIAGDLCVETFPIRPLAGFCARSADIAVERSASRARRPAGARSFGLLLVDGLSLAEEQLAAALYAALEGVPIVGGSAGDDLAFSRTHVLVEGEFVTGAAVLALFDTTTPFETLKFQHFQPSKKRLVITGADPEARRVTEINGLPAAEAYAQLLGVELGELGPALFSANPVMLKLGGEHFIRSIRSVNADLSMTFLCAIDAGLALRLGECVDAVSTAKDALESMRFEKKRPEIILGCDCILRRLELEKRGLDDAVGRLFVEQRVVGFSTYGEQWNGIHVNQTFTGVALGARHD